MKKFLSNTSKVYKVYSVQTSLPFKPFTKDNGKLVGLGLTASSFGSMSGVGSGKNDPLNIRNRSCTSFIKIHRTFKTSMYSKFTFWGNR